MGWTRASSRSLIGSSLAAISITCHAQTPPDAGAILQEIERNRRQALPTRPGEIRPLEQPILTTLPGDRVTVKRFNFIGNTRIGSDQLATVVAPWLGRPLSFAELRETADVVARHYREAGWMVRVILPKQDVSDGIVTLKIIEAVFGGARREGNTPLRLKMSLVLERIEAQLPKGELLKADAIERGLLLADDLPGVKVSGSLRAAEKNGETELILKIDDEPLIRGDVAVNNSGPRSTGSNQLSANLTLASPFGFGEQFNASAMHSEGIDYARLSASLPIGTDGWRAGIHTSSMRYELITVEFAGQDGRGSSDTYGLEASYPIIRTRNRNLYLQLNVDHKKFDNRFFGAVQSHYDSTTWSAGLSGDLTDNWGGGGLNRASVTFHRGRIDLEKPQPSESGFSKVRYSMSRQQTLSEELALYAQFIGQESRDPLDSSENFTLGGASGVRAYPSSEGSGVSGQIINLELSNKLPFDLVLSGFYDWGHVRNRDLALSYSLKGYGLAIDWKAPGKINLKATWARRHGDNPNPTTTGKDQDGTLDRNRLWLSANLPF